MRFSTDAVRTRDRFELFRDGFMARYSALEMLRDKTVPFRGAFRLLRAGPITVARLDTSPLTFRRTPKLVKDDDDAINLVFCRQGRYFSSQNENDIVLGRGQGLILDATRVAVLQALDKDNSRWSIKVPRATLTAAVARADDLGGTRIAADNHAQRLLFHYIESVQRSDLGTESPLTELFNNHVFDLIAHALGAHGEARKIAEQRGIRHARRQSIMREIERNFAAPGLRASVVAARLGVTPRYVHRLLEETGKTFSELILEQRLNRAMQLLTDSGRNHQRIAEIAYEAGFTDLSHFNRTFRRRFGENPSGARGAPRADIV
jgi:AraC-like DNA-binding protein